MKFLEQHPIADHVLDIVGHHGNDEGAELGLKAAVAHRRKGALGRSRRRSREFWIDVHGGTFALAFFRRRAPAPATRVGSAALLRILSRNRQPTIARGLYARMQTAATRRPRPSTRSLRPLPGPAIEVPAQ